MNLPVLKIGTKEAAYPIIQGGMAVRVSTAPLAGEVARCGGIGVIGATGMSPEELAEEIRQARIIAGNGIIGVNIMFAAAGFSELVQTSLDEAADIIFVGAGFSKDIFRRAAQYSTAIVPIVSSDRAARLSEKCGATAVVAEGAEAGGHLGTDRSIMDILPEIKRAVKIPVVAAGGICDGQDMAALIRAGADGVQLATRFVLSNECAVSPAFKQTLLNADHESITLIKSPVGLPGRAIRTEFTDSILSGQLPRIEKCIKCLKECSHSFCIIDALIRARDGDTQRGLFFSGQNVGRITNVLPVKVIMEDLIRDCKTALDRMSVLPMAGMV